MKKSLLLSLIIFLGLLNLYAQDERSDEIMPEAPPAWEANINNMLDVSTEVTIQCYDRMEPYKPLPKNATYVRNKEYIAVVTIKNVAKALDFEWLEIRLTKKQLPYAELIEYYSNSYYSGEVERVVRKFWEFEHGEQEEALLYFRVKQELKEFELIRYGLYGELVPMGRRWNSLHTNDVEPKGDEF